MRLMIRSTADETLCKSSARSSRSRAVSLSIRGGGERGLEAARPLGRSDRALDFALAPGGGGVLDLPRAADLDLVLDDCALICCRCFGQALSSHMMSPSVVAFSTPASASSHCPPLGANEISLSHCNCGST